MRFATAVPTKGASGRFSSDKALQFMEEVGDKTSKVIVKTDQEPSIKYLVNDIVEGRPLGQTVVELSPVKSSGSNGIVEKSIQELEGQLRATLLALEARVGRELKRQGAHRCFHARVFSLLVKSKRCWVRRENGL